MTGLEQVKLQLVHQHLACTPADSRCCTCCLPQFGVSGGRNAEHMASQELQLLPQGHVAAQVASNLKASLIGEPAASTTLWNHFEAMSSYVFGRFKAFTKQVVPASATDRVGEAAA